MQGWPREISDPPVEDIQPHNPALVPVDLDSTNPHPLLAFFPLIVSTTAGQEQHKSNNRQARSRGHLVQLVLGIFILGKSAGLCGSLLFAYDDGCCNGREDERVEETERESFVLLWDHSSEEGGENRETDDAKLRNLKGLETRRGFARQGPECEDHDFEVSFWWLWTDRGVANVVAYSDIVAALSSLVVGRAVDRSILRPQTDYAKLKMVPFDT